MKMIHPAAERACYVARSVDETPTLAVLKEALETVSEIELLPHPGSFFHYISKLPEQVKTC